MADFFVSTQLLERPPITRAAYSDRTAWIMAEIARLVYEPLPSEVSVDNLAEEIREAVVSGQAADAVEALVRRAVESESGVPTHTVEALRAANFELLETFAHDGTEALLARLSKTEDSEEGMLILAFRGTQPGITDVLTDVKADLVTAPKQGRIHRGFLEAFERVSDAIERALEKHAGPPVYITGHSLGGALAIVATRYLERNGTGACYTFGGPRVGDDAFFEGIKTPVYRVVNAADGVARVPFGYGLKIVLGGLRLIPLNGTLAVSEFLRKRFAGYTHFGNLVFLSDAPNTPDSRGFPFAKLQVRKSPNFFWKSQQVLWRLIGTYAKASGTDHSIREYAGKLEAHALRRN